MFALGPRGQVRGSIAVPVRTLIILIVGVIVGAVAILSVGVTFGHPWVADPDEQIAFEMHCREEWTPEQQETAELSGFLVGRIVLRSEHRCWIDRGELVRLDKFAYPPEPEDFHQTPEDDDDEAS